MAVEQKNKTTRPEPEAFNRQTGVQNAPAKQVSPDASGAPPTGLPEGVTRDDLSWWNNPLNRNFMAGDGPMAGQTEVEGTAQSASSMQPEVREATLAESLQAEQEKAADDAKSAKENSGDTF